MPYGMARCSDAWKSSQAKEVQMPCAERLCTLCKRGNMRLGLQHPTLGNQSCYTEDHGRMGYWQLGSPLLVISPATEQTIECSLPHSEPCASELHQLNQIVLHRVFKKSE